jgi:hypothetical protein
MNQGNQVRDMNETIYKENLMITMKEWMELIDYKITEGSTYCWQCYGPNAYTLDSWNGVHGKGGYSFSIVFSTKTQKVYEVSVCDYTNNRAYRMINPSKVEKHRMEATERGVALSEAWDDVDYVDLEVVDDFIQKCLAIKSGEDYDTRVSIPVDFTDEELLKYMKLAHEQDVTFNEFIEDALRTAIEQHKLDPEGSKARAMAWLESQPHGY